MSAPTPAPILVTIPGAAAMIGVSAETMRKYVNAGRVATVRLPGVSSGATGPRRVRVSDLQRFVESITEAAS